MNINNKIIYQIYPKSFKDSNGDGIGDLKGIISELDYIASLGVDYIWLTPIFMSPQNDNGYDISNYYHVDPIFGSDEDLEALILECKKRNLEIMFDMVLNHTSTEHQWFKKALKGEQKYMDYYFFFKEKYNWKSKFGGSAFEYVEDLDMYYLHLYDKTQADLNWENPEVFHELAKIVQYWIDKGISGFRFDVINVISKPETFENDFLGDGRKFYTDGPKVHHYVSALNRETFGNYPHILTVGELSSTDIKNAVKYTKSSRHELDTIFNFHHLKTDYLDGDKWALDVFDFISFKNILIKWQLAMQENDGSMSLFLNNHDQPRSVSRFACDEKFHYESATMLATIMFFLKGVPFIYQGEEIGLPNAYFDDIKLYRDVESINAYNNLLNKFNEEEALKIISHRSRDNGRTPMLWDNSLNYGFSTVEPWISFTKNTNATTVSHQNNDENSILNYYRKMINIRKNKSVFSTGEISFSNEDHANIFSYIRQEEDCKMLVFGNFSNEMSSCRFEHIVETIVLNNYPNAPYIAENKLELRPYEAIVIKAQ